MTMNAPLTSDRGASPRYADGVRASRIPVEPGPQALESRRRRAKRAPACTWLNATVGFERRSCNRAPLLTAKLSGSSWTYRIPKRIKLAAGRYRVTALAKTAQGFTNAAPLAQRRVTFTLSRR